MKRLLLIDFDGTLFNTLYPTYQILKKRLRREREKIQIHREYIDSNLSKLHFCGEVWKNFLKNFTETYQTILISETSENILRLYLESAYMEPFFTQVKGSLFHRGGDRKRYLVSLLDDFQTEQVILISDSPKDFELEHLKLTVFNSNQFFSSDLCFLRQELTRIRVLIFKLLSLDEKNTANTKSTSKEIPS